MYIFPIQVYFMALIAGFTPRQADTLVCVAKHESNFNTLAFNENKNYTQDHGILQINDIWNDVCRDLNLYDAQDNIHCGFRIFKQYKNKFTAWVAYKKHKAECDNYVVPKCKLPDEIDNTGLKTPGDPGARAHAEKRCKEKFNKCLTSFTRVGERDYHAICGGSK